MDRNNLFRIVAPPIGVATREGGVDRNFKRALTARLWYTVATREGGVDRNIKLKKVVIIEIVVATREGGVDRNSKLLTNGVLAKRRHPRGWRG